jgi:hypothetical protein
MRARPLCMLKLQTRIIARIIGYTIAERGR